MEKENIKALFKTAGVEPEDLKKKEKTKLETLKKIGKRIFLTIFGNFKEV